jgi:hypothetical protein
MPTETEELISKLEPIIGKSQAREYLQRYHNGKFSLPLKKVVEREVRQLAQEYKLDTEIMIHPVPGRIAVTGEYSLGHCHYGVENQLNAQFGLRDQDFIKHIGVFGATGSGKTTTAFRIIRQLCEQGKPFIILDPKGTWQSVIRKDWAKDVKVLKLGSTYAPYTFDPFMPLPRMDIDTMISEVVEVFCDTQYLGYGAKNLLLRACYSARGKGRLTMRTVAEEFRNLHLTGQREKQWAASTSRALDSATTGILGRVLSLPDNILFDRLMDSSVVIVMDQLVDHDQVAMFNGFMLNRIYWWRKLAGIREKFKHLLVIEEFHVLSSAEKAKGESRIEFLVKMCREFSQGVMFLEQNPGRISDAVLGNLNTLVSMKLGHSKDINAVSMAMALRSEHRTYLSRLPTGWAVCKSGDRMNEPVLVKVDYEAVEKSEVSPEEIREHNGDFVSEIPEESLHARPEERKGIAEFPGRDKLGTLDKKMLRVITSAKPPNLRNVYTSLGVSYRRGNTLRQRLARAGLIVSEDDIPTEKGKETRLYLTEAGERYFAKTLEAKRLGGEWHRSAVQKVAGHYREQGFVVHEEYRDIDVFVDRGSEEVAVEVESLSGTKDYVHAVSNALKALRRADRLEIVVKDRASGKKLKEALNRSPLKSSRAIKIRLLDEYV